MAKKRTPEEITAINADLRKRFGSEMTRKQMMSYLDETGVFPVWIYRNPELKGERGKYLIPEIDTTMISTTGPFTPHPDVPTPVIATSVAAHAAEEMEMDLTADFFKKSDVATRMEAIRQQASLLSTIPPVDPSFVPFGDYEMVSTVVKSRQFFPVMITGLSGNGKTFQVEQSCAAAKREYIRVNITAETDEDDLFGGFRLVDGNTIFELGPVIVAMLRGAVLLMDEVDLGGSKIMYMQPVLEGKPVTLKKIGITVAPAPGFTIFATGNTKGQGDERGKFVGTNLLNEAFLERFPVMVEQEYPDIKTEKRILAKNFVAAGFKMSDHAATFFDTLAKWAENIRVTYTQQGIDEVISTRRLCHIVRAYGLFGYDDEKALTYCVNRFDEKSKDAFMDLYNKLAPDAAAPSNVGSLDGDDMTDIDF